MRIHRCLASFPGKVIIMQMSHSRLAIVLSGLAVLVSGNAVRAGEGGLCCSCPPPMKWCSEGAPRIKFKCACPRPVCDPCSLQHYGYYATCWQPWPFQQDWSHCKTPPPGVVTATDSKVLDDFVELMNKKKFSLSPKFKQLVKLKAQIELFRASSAEEQSKE